MVASRAGRSRYDALGPIHPCRWPIDGEQLAQAFRSVLSNAVDAAPEASDLSFSRPRSRTVAGAAASQTVASPFAPELLPRVFEPFLSTKPGSTGTGLAFAQRIIDEHDGTIHIESSAQDRDNRDSHTSERHS